MFHLTRCCLCVSILAVTTAFAQTSHTPTRSSPEDAPGAALPNQAQDHHEQFETQRQKVLTRAIKSLERRLAEAPSAPTHIKTKTNKERMVSMVVSIQPLIRMGLEEPAIVSALNMITRLREDARISTSFHEGTGLLFIKTDFATISLVDEVFEQLEVTAYARSEEARKRRQVGSSRH